MNSLCINCRYQHERHKPLPVCDRNATALVVGGFPDMVSFERGIAFSGYRYSIPRRIAASVGMNSGVCFSYGVRCYPCYNNTGRFKLPVEMIDRCCGELRDSIDMASNLKVIVALGPEAYRALGIPGITGENRGMVRKFGEIPVVCTFSIMDVLRNEGLLTMMAADFQKAYVIASGSEKRPDPVVTVLTDADAVKEKFAELEKLTTDRNRPLAVSFDTETTSLTPWHDGDRVIAMSFCWDVRECVSFPFEHRDADLKDDLYDTIKHVFELPNIAWVYHNAKFDMQWLWKYGIDCPRPYWDTLIAEHCLDEDKEKAHGYGLKTITKDRFWEYGGYEDELTAKRDASWEAKRKAAASDADTKLEKRVADWLALSDEERQAKLSEYVAWGVLQLSDCCAAGKLKTKKVKGGEPQPTKKFLADVRKVLKKLPETETAEVECTYEDIELPTLLHYAALDAFCTRAICRAQMPEFNADAKLANANPKLETVPSVRAFKSISMPLVYNLAKIEYHGIRFDREAAKQYMQILRDKELETREEIFSDTGFTFNINSARELSDVLYGKCGLEVPEYTETGEPSVSEDTLKGLSERNPDLLFVQKILWNRKLNKIANTYIKNWLRMSEETGYLHCTFRQTGTATFRLSSAAPNLQNLPFNLRLGDTINLNLKKLFLPDEGFVFCDLDIKNAEMRTACAYSKDENLINAFNNGIDLHSLTAAGLSDGKYSYDQIRAKKEDKNSEEYKLRHVAKMVSFGTIYGITCDGLARNLWNSARVKITPEEAQEYLNGFFKTYPGIQKYMEDTTECLNRYRLVATYTGRRRHFPVMMYGSRAQRNARQAINARIQSTSSDLVMMCLNRLNNWLLGLGDGSQVLLTVHDSVPFQFRLDNLEQVKAALPELIIEQTAADAPWLPVKWEYDAAWGPSYGETDNPV